MGNVVAWAAATLIFPVSVPHAARPSLFQPACACLIPCCSQHAYGFRKNSAWLTPHRLRQCPGLHSSICCWCCRANAQQPKLFVGMVLILIFAEALALYGLIGELS